MLTAVIAAPGDPIALADTLAALVPAAVDGLVRRVLVVTDGPASSDMVALIDASGADHLAAAGDALALWRAGLAQAPPGWRLCLVAGMVPAGDWRDVVRRHIARPTSGPAVLQIEGGWAVRLAAIARRIAGRPKLAAGRLLRDTNALDARALTLKARIENQRG